VKGFRLNKEKYIIKQLDGSYNVLHVGCTNSPNTIERWNNGTLLHRSLCNKAKIIGAYVIGIDIDDMAINFLKDKMPDEDILNLDAHKLFEYFGEYMKFNLIIAGDVIEHLPNPGLFLTSCASVLSPDGHIIITTTNAYGIVRFIKMFLNHEAIHDEHTVYFSHKTLDRLIKMCGMSSLRYGYYKCEPITSLSLNRLISNLIENVICLIWPQFSEGIVITAKAAEGKCAII